MEPVTLESLAERIEALERALHLRSPVPGRDDWQRAVGMFAGSEFMKRVDEEGRRIRESERTFTQQEPNSTLRPPTSQEVEYSAKVKSASSLEELFAIMETAPPLPDDYDLCAALNANRKETGERPVW